MPTLNGDDEVEKRDSLIFELTKRRFDSEDDRTKNLEGKVGNLVGLLLGAGSLLSGGEILKSSILSSSRGLTDTPYFVGVASLLISIGCALIALKIRRWIIVRKVQTLIKEYTSLSFTEVLRRMLLMVAKAIVLL
jgi:hypothetical protein